MHEKYQQLLLKKKDGIPFSVLTAYDYPTARILQEADVDVILVGDSVGTNVLGYESEREVTMADMVHHLGAVMRGAPQSYLMVDLPYASASDPETAFDNAETLINAGAHIVKIEGWGEKKAVVGHLAKRNMAVCAHIGYNPQYHGPKGRVFGKDAAGARELIDVAETLEQAGAAMLLVEKVPEEVCGIITERSSIPVIGIGSGRFSDAQVLVVHDVIGLGWRTFRHAKAYADIRMATAGAVRQFVSEVTDRTFPGEKHVNHLNSDVLSEIETCLEKKKNGISSNN